MSEGIDTATIGLEMLRRALRQGLNEEGMLATVRALLREERAKAFEEAAEMVRSEDFERVEDELRRRAAEIRRGE